MDNLFLDRSVLNSLLNPLDRDIFCVFFLDCVGKVFCDVLDLVIVGDCLLHGYVMLDSLLLIFDVGSLDWVVLEPRLALDWRVLVGIDTQARWTL